MSWNGPEFVIAIIGMSIVGWIVTTWIRARHGYPLENEWGGMTAKEDTKAAGQIASLNAENGALKGQVERLEARLAVLERIATDPAERTAREIERLR